jgi:hypothetical protein
MFGLYSLSTVLLVVLYGLGVLQMVKGARNAGYGWTAALTWAATWPVTLWKVMNDLWKSKPPVL